MSKKKQLITWMVFLILSPKLYITAFYSTASLELFTYPSFYVFIIAGIIVSMFPFRIQNSKLFLVTSMSIATLLTYGLFAEMLLTSLAIFTTVFRTGITKEEHYRIPINVLMFQILSTVSAALYYYINPLIPNIVSFRYSLLSITVYAIAYITLNRVLLYLVMTKWQNLEYGELFGFEYLFSLASCLYTLPIAVMTTYLNELYGVPGILIAASPLITLSFIFKLYFNLDRQKKYLAEINELAVNLASKQVVEEIVQIYFKFWKEVFSADTIYYYTVNDAQKLVKTRVYQDGLDKHIEDGLASSVLNSALEESLQEDKMVVYGRSKEWVKPLRNELDYPAETVLILPIKREQKVIGLIMITDSKRNAYDKVMLSMIPVMHNYMNIALEKAYNFEELKINSRTDHLTGISNLRAFEEYITHFNETNPETALSVLIIDLDHFKRINDSYGHQAGNELLKQVAILLSTFVYEQERLARYGGEEFIFFIPEKSVGQAYDLAESIRKKIKETDFNTHNYLSARELVTINMTASIGVSTYPVQCDNIQDLMMLADRAMYVGSKQKGRNKVSSICREGKFYEADESAEVQTVF